MTTNDKHQLAIKKEEESESVYPIKSYEIQTIQVEDSGDTKEEI